MPENFSIQTPDDQNETLSFQEDQNWPIELDGTLSAVEINELHEAFECDCWEVRDETWGKLWEFLQQDILPNIQNLNPEAQNKALILAEAHSIPKIDLDLSIPNDLQAMLDTDWFDLSIWQAISWIEDYVSQNMQLPENSDLSWEQYDWVIWLLGEIVQDNISGITKVIKEKVAANPQYSAAELQWIINWEVQTYLSTLRDEAIVPMQEFIHLSSADNRETRVYSQIRTPYEAQAEVQWLEWQEKNDFIAARSSLDIDHFDFQYDRLKSELLSSNMDTSRFKREYDLLFWSNTGLAHDIQLTSSEESGTSLDMNLLSEEAKKTEARMGVGYLCAVAVSCLPYVWAAADAAEVGSAEDMTAEFVKSTLNAWSEPGEEFVDPNYRMEKWMIDNVMAWAGIVLSIVWLQALAKWRKIAKALSMMENVDSWTISQVISLFSQKMWLWAEANWALKSMMWVDPIPEVANMNRAPNIQQDVQRTTRHSTPEYFESVWGRGDEYWFVDETGQLHINTTLFQNLPEADRSRVMREFIAHERAHQAIMNLPPWELQGIHQSFIKNDVFSIVWDAQRYGLHFRPDMWPLDTTNEILAHMIWRLRVWKDVPENILSALSQAWYDDVLWSFGINASRDSFINNWWVRNSDELVAAAMTQVWENLFDINTHTLRTIKSHSTEVVDLLNSFHQEWWDIWEALAKINFEDPWVINAVTWSITQINWLIEVDSITKIENYLSSQGLSLPSWLDIADLKDAWDTGITEDFLQGLFSSLKEIRTWAKAVEEIQEVSIFDLPDSEFLNTIRTRVENLTPWYDFNLVIQKASLDIRALLQSYGWDLDIHSFMLCKNLWQEADLELPRMRHILTAITWDRRNSSRLISKMNSYNRDASDAFVNHFHTDWDTYLSMNSINSFFMANPDIKVLNVRSLNFDEADERWWNLYRSLVELAQREWTNTFVNPTMFPANMS